MNPRELDVLNILWKSSEPMMATDIVNAGEGLTQSTVTAVLRKLLHAKLVEVVGVTHSGKVLSRTYRPTEASRKTILQNFTDSYASFTEVIPKTDLCAAILQIDSDSPDSKEKIAQLRALLDKYETKHGKKK